MTGEAMMKLFGILGAILVIMGFFGVARPLLTTTPTLSENRETAATSRAQGHIEQVLGGAAIIIGFALVGVEIHHHK